MPDATTIERQAADAVGLLRVIGNMLADGELGVILDESGDRGAQLRADLMLAILDVMLPDAEFAAR